MVLISRVINAESAKQVLSTKQGGELVFNNRTSVCEQEKVLEMDGSAGWLSW